MQTYLNMFEFDCHSVFKKAFVCWIIMVGASARAKEARN